tara:strand:+ start:16 stop:390 length:375 start_codon:yes stop_codon:yes gene_type:complete
MQRVGTLFLIYLFLFACISWIPAPYRLKERFSTGSGFNMAPLETPAEATQADEQAAEASAAEAPAAAEDAVAAAAVEDCSIYCPNTNDDVKNMVCDLDKTCSVNDADCDSSQPDANGYLVGTCM